MPEAKRVGLKEGLRALVPHKHTNCSKPGVGLVQLCNRWGKVTAATLRYDENSQCWVIPLDRLEEVMACDSYLEAMQILRREPS